MWGGSSKNCENGCQCSGLITDRFKINSGNNATKRKQEESLSTNFKLKMNPHSLDFKSPLNSPISTSKRRILGEITNSNQLSTDTPSKRRVLGEIMNNDSPRNSPLQRLKIEDKKSPLIDHHQSPLQRLKVESMKSPSIDRNSKSPVTSRSFKRSTTKISRIFEERTKFKMSNKENVSLLCNETFVRLDVEEETRDSFGGFRSHESVSNWSMTKLDFADALQTTSKMFEENTKTLSESEKDLFVPEKEMGTHLDPEFETLHDLEEEFEADNFDSCTKYEIISTDSPNIISRGRTSSSRKVNSKDFVFGAPLAENEPSTSFNKPNVNATRMLNFEDEMFEFTSPAAKRSTASFSVKKSLKFSETTTKSALRFDTPTKSSQASNVGGTPSKSNLTPTRNPLRHEKSDSSIGSMLSSPGSSHFRLFTSESTTSMESGFISEFEEPFLELEEPSSNSPKLPNFNDLLSGQIKENIITNKNFLRRPTLQRSLSFNPEPRAKSLFSINEKESPEQERKSHKRQDSTSENVVNKKRKSSCSSPLQNLEKNHRPVLQRAFSENHASIMSALARSATEPDLIGDFSLPYALPLIGGDHADLKSISCDTLAALIRGEYGNSVEDFKIIDCRYPYEFSGGHIPGALNLYTPSLVQRLLTSQDLTSRALVTSPDLMTSQRPGGRSVLVFHCEFSIERGPKLYRYLRSSDRSKNMENYPHLNYPEIYLLHQGYRTFHQKYPELCTDGGYTAMLDPKHSHLLKKHRSATKVLKLLHC